MIIVMSSNFYGIFLFFFQSINELPYGIKNAPLEPNMAQQVNIYIGYCWRLRFIIFQYYQIDAKNVLCF